MATRASYAFALNGRAQDTTVRSEGVDARGTAARAPGAAGAASAANAAGAAGAADTNETARQHEELGTPSPPPHPSLITPAPLSLYLPPELLRISSL